MAYSLRECVENAMQNTPNDFDVPEKISRCMARYRRYIHQYGYDYNHANVARSGEQQLPPPDQIIGGKKSRRRRHLHKSRRNRRKSHKRK
jgi:hypothetical protein